jgi:hypothetical protein
MNREVPDLNWYSDGASLADLPIGFWVEGHEGKKRIFRRPKIGLFLPQEMEYLVIMVGDPDYDAFGEKIRDRAKEWPVFGPVQEIVLQRAPFYKLPLLSSRLYH